MATDTTSKSTTYKFTLGGTQRFSLGIDLPAHARTPLINGSALVRRAGRVIAFANLLTTDAHVEPAST